MFVCLSVLVLLRVTWTAGQTESGSSNSNLVKNDEEKGNQTEGEGVAGGGRSADGSVTPVAVAAGLLSRLFSVIQKEKERVFMPSTDNCSTPLLSENVLRNVEWNYFSYRINKDGMTRFDRLRRRLSYITSYADFQRILFPSATEQQHPFFNCAFNHFFNHLMNRTPYIWLHWVDFDGSSFPFVSWKRVNV